VGFWLHPCAHLYPSIQYAEIGSILRASSKIQIWASTGELFRRSGSRLN
jgi:hypothetical protein